MHDQRWDIELLEVFGEVGFRKGLDAVVRILQAGREKIWYARAGEARGVLPRRGCALRP
jgi:hypothetical protein